MKKNSKRLLILCLTIAIFASIGMAGFAYAEEINPPVMITEKAIYSTFEDDVISPWVGADATLSISDDAHSGAKALKAVGSGSATIQATVTEGNGNELFTNAVWHDISFWAKPSTAATLNVYFYIFTSDGDNKQIGLALGDTMPLDYTKYSCGISAIVQEGQLAVRWQRTDMASPTSDKFMTLDQGIVISRIRMDIVASSSELYIDDISMTREVPEPITEIIDKTVFADKFEDGNSDGWEGGQGNANSSHTITDDVKSGSGAVLSTLKTGQTQNRIQTLPIKVGGTSSVQPQQAYYNINFWAKSNADTMLNSMIYINCSDTKSQAITMSSEVLVSSTYANYRGDIAFYVEGGLLKFKWQRFDGGGSSGSLALSPEAEISNIVLVFFTSADKFYIDDFKMSTKVELPRTITKVTKAIDAIGTVTDDSTAAITAANAAYSALDSSLRAQVYNYNELRAANRAFRLLDGVYNANLEFDEQNISLTLGAISDTHNDAPKIAKAMTSLKSFAGGGGLNALIIAGDISDRVQYDNNIAEIAGVKKNFEDNIPAETDVFFALGNHDSSNGSHAADFYDGLGSRFYKGELNPDARTSGNRHAVIGGYNFISVEASYAPEMISADNLKFLNDTLQSIVTDPSYDGRYIFVVCHVSPPNTVFGASPINDIDSVLKNYSQAILLSGHSHYPINDERSIMQTNYTTLGLGSVSYMAMPKGYLETNADELVSDSYSLSMGTMIQIDNNGNIKITRIDFTQNKQIKSAWYLAAPKLDETHMCSYPKERGTTFAIAPVMPQAAAINAVYTAGNTVRVTFTPATDDDMVFSYGVQFFDDGAAQPYASYYSLSPFYRYPDLSLMPTADITVTIGSVTKLPHTVKVFAQDSYGTKSGDISCTAVKSDNTNTVTKDVLIINPNTETYSLDAIYELSLKEDFSQLLDNVGILSAHIGKDLYLRTKATASHNVGAAIKFIPDSYTVTLPQSDKFTITPDKAEKLTYLKGADFKFLLSFAAGYENYNAIVKANDIALNKTDNKYSVAVSGAVAITVDLTIQSFSITLPTVIGATVEQITDSTTVNKGDDYKFRLTLAEDYNLSTVVVKVNDVILTAVDGVYTVENVTQNITITLEGVTKNPAIEPPTTTKKGCSAANAAALLSGLLALALVVLKIKR